MSYPNQSFWMAKCSGIPSDGEMAFENASKRPHQWLLDCPEANLLPNKKHSPEIPTSNLFSNVPAWGNTFCFQSVPGQFTERLFDADTTRAVNTEKVILGRNGIEETYSDHSFALSMSHTLEDSQSPVSYGGIRKVKVSQVKDSDSPVPSTNAQNYNRTEDNKSLSATNAYRVDENSLAFGKEEENFISESYEKENGVFISMNQPYSKRDEDLSLAHYNDNNSFASGLAFNNVDEGGASKGNMFHRERTSVCSDGVYNRNSNVAQDSCSRGQSTFISFGGSNDDANNSGRIISSYESLMAQSTPQLSETPTSKGFVDSRTNNGLGSHVAFSSVDVSSKKEGTKVSKKVQSNNFPSNVRSLLSTGMLDGVPVKYIAWSREKELHGVIKGSGYLCGCDSCDSSKVVNAYEFERHAGCKTKHPNNHIYFENGKTIYGIVQELRNTPQDMLFSVIPTMTGSTINQKSFRMWKESFLAATRELQRIYGKEGGKLL
uniref:Tify domain-containing protein n=1 Tax=Noccaea caerulescens TaxID=107243 RepID=A0A1J3IZR6_NOCCA